MTKLEELGGLEAAKQWVVTLKGRIGYNSYDAEMYEALIEQVESLASERNQLLDRLEGRGGHLCNHATCENIIGPRDYAVCIPCFETWLKRVEELEHSWKCFRCGELFTEYEKAAEHFNGDFCEDEEPWCQFVKRMEAAEKRVEELERERNCPPFDPNDLPTSLEMNEDGSVSQVLETVGGDRVEPFMERVKVLEAQLQAARKLADAVKLWHNRQAMHSFKLEDCNHLVCAKARDFLKMLEDKHE